MIVAAARGVVQEGSGRTDAPLRGHAPNFITIRDMKIVALSAVLALPLLESGSGPEEWEASHHEVDADANASTSTSTSTTNSLRY